MMLHIPEVLSAEQVATCRALVEAADWVDGNATAGFQSRAVKNNRQLPEGSGAARRAGAMILDALDASPLFASAALPARVFPPLFNRYEGGESFGNHVDNAIRRPRDSAVRLRTDLSATLFLASPDEYDGGELVIDDTYGAHSVKLPAGDLILYPASSLHRVLPVTRGARLASFFWVQSLIRDDAQRTLLFQMDLAIIRLRERVGDDDGIVGLTGIYHNLLRRWASLA
jgi:PKHD-type hydroxylase